jgi:serpin B
MGGAPATNAAGLGGLGVAQVRSSLAREAPRPDAERTASEDLARFAWAFAEQVRDPARNFVYSPYSIVLATAMLSAGAEGETLTEIQTALQFASVGETLHRSQNALAQQLAGRNRDGQELRVSNDLWMTPSLSPSDGFLDTLARQYGAGIFQAPFVSDLEAARQAINQKVSQDTAGLIPEILAPAAISQATKLVLTNSVYLRARWAEPFPPARTELADFTSLAGTPLSVSMMHGLSSARYFVGDGFFALALPYRQNELEMVFLVPALGQFPTFLPTLAAQRVADILAALQPELVDLSLPKLNLDFGVGLEDALGEAGMERAFDAAAEFGPIGQGIFVQNVFHRAVLKLDEQGTIAAASTVVGAAGAGSGPPPTPVPVVVDRPFVFFLRDTSTGAILFLGHVVDPS